jgi:hygromycin-B 4-O-kinase
MKTLRRIPGGDESETFSFRYGKEEFILRVSRSAAGFEKDAFASKHFGRHALPVPEILHIGEIDAHRYCSISRRLPGVTLQDLNEQKLPAVLDATAQVLREIASSDISGITGFGPFDANGIGRYRTWREFLLSPAPDFAPLAYLASYCPEIRCLVHGDFGSNNVLTDGRRITGVLDWSEAMIGDPLYDIANIFFWRGWLVCMEQQARWFEARLGHIPNWRERLLCYQLVIGLKETRVTATAV